MYADDAYIQRYVHKSQYSMYICMYIYIDNRYSHVVLHLYECVSAFGNFYPAVPKNVSKTLFCMNKNMYVNTRVAFLFRIHSYTYIRTHVKL